MLGKDYIELDTPTPSPMTPPNQFIFQTDDISSSDDEMSSIENALGIKNEFLNIPKKKKKKKNYRKCTTQQTIEHTKQVYNLQQSNKSLKNDVKILKGLVISERKKRISALSKLSKFVNVVVMMKKDYEARLRRRDEELKKQSLRMKKESFESKKKIIQSKRSSLALSSLFLKRKKSSAGTNSTSGDAIMGIAELQDYEKKIRELKVIIGQKNMICESQFESIKMKDEIIRKITAERLEKEERLKVVEEELEKANEKLKMFVNEKIKLKSNEKKVTKKNEEMEKMIDELKSSEEEYKKEIINKTDSLAKLSFKLVEMKTKLKQFNMKRSEYVVNRVISGSKMEKSKLILRENPKSKTVVLEILTRKKNIIVQLNEVSHVYFLTDTKYANRFCIKFNNVVEQFQSLEREEIVTKIRNFMKV